MLLNSELYYIDHQLQIKPSQHNAHTPSVVKNGWASKEHDPGFCIFFVNTSSTDFIRFVVNAELN